jgi:WD40 repeat protein
MNKVKVLFLAANPAGTPTLKLDEEIRQITAKVRASEYRESLELVSRWAVRPDDLLQALEEVRPHIVHFSGHGSQARGLILLDDHRQPKSVSQDALVHLFRTLKDNVRVVVFNACYSQPQAKALTKTIDCIIGMNRAIGDEAAIIFAASFYRAIGFGRSVKEAFEQGRAALLLESIAEDKTPELLTRRGVSAAKLVLIPPMIKATPTDLLREPPVGPSGPRDRTPAGRQTPTDALDRLDLVPDLPKHHLPREEEVVACREKLLASNSAAIAITAPQKTALAVRGMGGAGKSVLAIAVARDDTIQRHFVHGIFWVTVGQENAGSDAKAAAILSDLASRLGCPIAKGNLHHAKQELRKFLAKKACLIILDDLWNTIDAQRLEIVERPTFSRILFTTREGHIVTDLDTEEVRVDKLTVAQAVALLSDWCERSVEGDADALTVARECGYLPLALAVCGAMARDGASWSHIAGRLRDADLSFLKRRGLHPKFESVLKCLAVSVEHLKDDEPELAQRYQDLAVFPPDQSVPESVVAMLWAETSRCPPDQAGIDLNILERKSLLTLEGTAPNRRVSLHDLQHDCVKKARTDLVKLHLQILEAYRRRCPRGWASGPDDKYFFQHLPYHLTEARLRDELSGLLLDLGWLEAKLKATEVVQLIADFDLAAADEAITLMQDALRLSAHRLDCDHTLLRSQLHGRLLGIESAEVQRLLRDTGSRSPWLRCVTPTLTAPGGELIRTLEHIFPVSAVAMSGDGTRAVSGLFVLTLNLWDLTTGQVLRTLDEHDSEVTAVAMSSDGTRAVSGSNRETLKLWDLTTGRLLRSFVGHAGRVMAVAMSGDGTRAVSGSDDKTLKLWDLATGRLLRTLDGHAGEVTAVAMSSDGTRAFSGSRDATLKLWDLASGNLLRTLKGHAYWATGVAMTNDGTRAISGCYDCTVKVWDLATDSLPRTLESHAGGVSGVAMTNDGTRAISGSGDKTLKLWDLATGRLLRTLDGHAGWVRAVAMSGDGTRAVSGSDDKTLKLWDLTTGRLLRSFVGHAGGVMAVAMSSDGTRAVSSSGRKKVKVWDLTTGSLLRTLKGHTDNVEAVGTNGDGTRAVSGSDDYTVKVWDLATGSLLRTLEGHDERVTAVAMSGDGTRAVSLSYYDATLKVWDLATGQVVTAFAADYPLNCCASSTQAETLVAGDMSGRVHILRFDIYGTTT